MFLEDLDTVDGRDLMTPETTKWIRISHDVMRAGISPCVRDGPVCKTKWNQLIPDYKRIADYLSRTGRNVPDYWELSASEQQSEGLPRHFSEEFYRAINDWYGSRPQINPPHVRDIMAPNDANYRPHEGEPHSGDQDHNDSEDAMDFEGTDGTEGTGGNTPPQSPHFTSLSPCRAPAPSSTTSTPNLRPPIGMATSLTPQAPQVISSSDTSEFTFKHRSGNIGV